MKFLHGIRFRFTLWYLLVLAMLLALLGAGVFLTLSRTLRGELDAELKARAGQLISIRNVVGIIERGRFEDNVGELITFFFRTNEEIVAVAPRNRALTVSQQLIDSVIGGERVLTTIEAAGGGKLRVFAVPYVRRFPPHAPVGHSFDPPLPGAPPIDDPAWQRLREREGRRGLRGELGARERRFQGVPPPLDQPGALFIARSTEGIETALTGLLRTLLLAVPLTLLIAGAGGAFLAGRVLRPVDEIALAAREIEESDLTRRIDVHTRDELGNLAATLNDMIARLEKAFARQRQFTGDASHELRTPLAVIEAETTLALSRERSLEEYRTALETVVQETEHMSAIIDQLLRLARADAGKETLSFADVGLGGLLEELCTAYEGKCAERGLALRRNIAPDVPVSGDTAMLRLLFQNLIDNALRYTPAGGTISVTLAREGDRAVATVSDTGIGIPAEDLPRVFDRFYRVDKARSRAEGGSGLGLSICRQIAELHGGSISAESKAGAGSAFTVRL